MSMYNLLFGTNPAGIAILATLGLTPSDVGRYRDCFVTEGKIAVYTRNGGGNRECYFEGNEDCGCQACLMAGPIPQHPQYISDRDDDFDSTYATIYYSFPDAYAEDLKKLDSGERFDPSARWLAMIAALESGA